MTGWLPLLLYTTLPPTVINNSDVILIGIAAFHISETGKGSVLMLGYKIKKDYCKNLKSKEHMSLNHTRYLIRLTILLLHKHNLYLYNTTQCIVCYLICCGLLHVPNANRRDVSVLIYKANLHLTDSILIIIIITAAKVNLQVQINVVQMMVLYTYFSCITLHSTM